MKKTHIIGIVLAVVIAAAGIAGFVWTGNAVRTAEQNQAATYQDYQTMCDHARQTTLTVTEDGVVVGTYSLDQLGVLQDTLANVDACFQDLDRMEPAAFSALSLKEKLQWRTKPTGDAVVALSNLNLEIPMGDLLAMTRTAPEDAYVEFVDGSFLVHQEQPGTALQGQVVQSAMAASLSGLTVTMAQAQDVRFEVTDCDCYVAPEKTVENTLFDFDAMLQEKLRTMTVTLVLHDQTLTLDNDALSQILTTDLKGHVQVDEDALTELVNGWHETYQEKNTPYLFSAQIGGIKPIEFLKVDYEIDTEKLITLMKKELVTLETQEIEVPWLCWRNGEAFSIADTYVEIDIPNQVMTYIQDGEVLVTTDIVTGASWGYPTPPGLYKVENKDTNCWLSGEDYNVHVDYWIGFIGYQIGIHDADWRTKFGGENYVKNGSHGCVNTPKAAVQVIFDHIEVGVPVLVYGK